MCVFKTLAQNRRRKFQRFGNYESVVGPSLLLNNSDEITYDFCFIGAERTLCRRLVFHVCVDHNHISGYGLREVQTSAHRGRDRRNTSLCRHNKSSVKTSNTSKRR